LPSRTQFGDWFGGQLAQGFEKPAVQLCFREQALQRREQPLANMEGIVWKLEIEERGLGLLVLTRDRENIVRKASCLRQRYVDHDQQIERVMKAAPLVTAPVGTSPWAYNADASTEGTKMTFELTDDYWGEAPGFENIGANPQSAFPVLVSTTFGSDTTRPSGQRRRSQT